MNYILSFAFIFINIFSAFGNNTESVAQLKRKLASEKDTSKVETLIALAEKYKNIDTDSMLLFASEAETLSNSINYERGKALSCKTKASAFYNMGNLIEAEIWSKKSIQIIKKYNFSLELPNSLNLLGLILMGQGKYYEAEHNFTESLKEYKSIKELEGQAKVLHNLGVTSFYQTNYEKAVNYYFRALKEAEKNNDTKLKAQILTNLGLVFSTLKDFKKAILYLRKSLLLYEVLIDEKGNAKTFSGLGSAFYNNGSLDSSLKYHKKALNSFVKIGDYAGKSESLNNIAEIFLSKSNYKKALVLLNESDSLRRENGDAYGLAITTQNKAKAYAGLKNYKLANELFTQSIKAAKDLGSIWLTAEIYLSRSEFYASQGNYKLALKDWAQRSVLTDSLFNINRTAIIAELDATYTAEKKEIEIQLKNNKIKLLEKEKLFFKIIFISALLIALLAGLLAWNINNKRIIKQQKKLELTTKNLELIEKSRELEESKRLTAEKTLISIETENKQVKIELDYKKKELTQLALYISQQNELFKKVRDELRVSNKDDFKKIVKDLEYKLNLNKQRESFELNVDLMNEDFYQRLTSQFIELTENEKKLCAMIRLGLSSKEIAAVVNISPKSVDMNRYRLRKKLSLKIEEDLSNFLMAI